MAVVFSERDQKKKKEGDPAPKNREGGRELSTTHFFLKKDKVIQVTEAPLQRFPAALLFLREGNSNVQIRILRRDTVTIADLGLRLLACYSFELDRTGAGREEFNSKSNQRQCA
uniref:Uncharacterized protein n=1 Tax=Sphaerodactylus townsendi TaxID=933632 RepID=A0ACB8FMT8_9SAUR